MKNLLPISFLVLLAACQADSTASDVPADVSGASRERTVQDGTGTPAASFDKDAQRRAARLERELHYWDGSERRSVWCSARGIVEFEPSDASRDALLAVAPEGREGDRPSGARLWNVASRADLAAFVGDLNRGASGARFSPLLHEGSTESSARRALPGGVLVQFRLEWDRARIDAFLAQQGLSIERPLAIGPNAFRLATPAGIESLEIANRLHDTGDLVLATPNWWRETSVR